MRGILTHGFAGAMVVSLLLAGSGPALAEQDVVPPTSCSSTPDHGSTCLFACRAGDTITIRAASGLVNDVLNVVAGAATCGGAAAACQEHTFEFRAATCSGSFRGVPADGVGVCAGSGTYGAYVRCASVRA